MAAMVFEINSRAGLFSDVLVTLPATGTEAAELASASDASSSEETVDMFRLHRVVLTRQAYFSAQLSGMFKEAAAVDASGVCSVRMEDVRYVAVRYQLSLEIWVSQLCYEAL